MFPTWQHLYNSQSLSFPKYSVSFPLHSLLVMLPKYVLNLLFHHLFHLDQVSPSPSGLEYWNLSWLPPYPRLSLYLVHSPHPFISTSSASQHYLKLLPVLMKACSPDTLSSFHLPQRIYSFPYYCTFSATFWIRNWGTIGCRNCDILFKEQLEFKKKFPIDLCNMNGYLTSNWPEDLQWLMASD